MTQRTVQTTTAALTAFFMLGALLGMSSCEAPPPETPAASTAQAAPASDPWQGMSDTELMAGVVYEPL